MKHQVGDYLVFSFSRLPFSNGNNPHFKDDANCKIILEKNYVYLIKNKTSFSF